MSSPTATPQPKVPSSWYCGWRETIWPAAILLVAAAVRLRSLRVLPVFIDEAIHIWGAVNYTDHPLAVRAQIGKVLGFIVFYPTARFAGDPLFATRALVALTGLLTVLGLYVAVRRLAGRLAAAAAAGIWSLMPYVVFHDRMALHDPLVSCFLVWAIVAWTGFLQRGHRRNLLLAGLFTGLAVATKVTALIALAWLLLIAAAYWGWAGLRRNSRLAQLFATGAIGPLLLFLPGAKMFLAGSSHFVESEGGNGSRIQLLVTNLGKIVAWITTYDSAAFTLFCGLVLLLAIRGRSRIKDALLLSFLLSCVADAFVFWIWFPRYFLPALLPLVMLAGIVTGECLLGALAVWRKRKESANFAPLGTAAVLAGLLALSATSWAVANWRFQADPYSARLPEEDRFQYLAGWPSGTGVRELTSFLDRTIRDSPSGITVFYVESFGRHVAMSVPLYSKEKHPAAVYRYQPVAGRLDIWRMLLEAAKGPTYLVLEPPIVELPPAMMPLIEPALRPVFEFKRPAAPGGFFVYRLDRSMYLKLPFSSPPAAGDAPKIADIVNSNGVEKVGEESFTWIGEDSMMLSLDSPRAGRVELAAEFSSGPSVAGTAQRRLLIKTSAGFTRQVLTSGGAVSIGVLVAAGRNEVLFAALDRPNVPSPLPNGDPRKLIVGLRGLHIAGFREGGAQPGQDSALTATCSASFGTGWYAREDLGKDWIRWNSGRSELTVYSEIETRATLRGEVFSMQRPNTVDLYLQGRKLMSWDITGSSNLRIPDVALSLGAGKNTLEFVSAQPAVGIPGDNRKLAVLVKNLEIAGSGPHNGCKLNP